MISLFLWTVRQLQVAITDVRPVRLEQLQSVAQGSVSSDRVAHFVGVGDEVEDERSLRHLLQQHLLMVLCHGGCT